MDGRRVVRPLSSADTEGRARCGDGSAWFRSGTREPFVYPEVATGNVAQLAVVVRFVNFGSAEVAFISADAATLRETRAAVRGAFLATLAPLGRAVLSVDAGRAHPNERAVPQLNLSTERSFGCLGYGIAWRIERREDTLAVLVDGVADPGAICPTAVGPAVRQHRLAGLAPGRYTLLISAQGDTNVFALAITDTSIALATRRATFVTADERVHWRAAEGTFDLMCHPDGPGERMCDSLHAWVARQGRVSRVERDSAGVPSYPPAFTASQGYLTRTYRFGDERVLRALQACIESLRPLLVETVGTQVLLSARPGGDVGIGSLRTFGEPHAQRPPEISGATAACPR